MSKIGITVQNLSEIPNKNMNLCETFTTIFKVFTGEMVSKTSDIKVDKRKLTLTPGLSPGAQKQQKTVTINSLMFTRPKLLMLDRYTSLPSQPMGEDFSQRLNKDKCMGVMGRRFSFLAPPVLPNTGALYYSSTCYKKFFKIVSV